MIIQIKDCIDCLNVINEDRYQYLFLFDHSSGHNCTAPDDFKTGTIRTYFWEKQPNMRNSVNKLIPNHFLLPIQWKSQSVLEI